MISVEERALGVEGKVIFLETDHFRKMTIDFDTLHGELRHGEPKGGGCSYNATANDYSFCCSGKIFRVWNRYFTHVGRSRDQSLFGGADFILFLVGVEKSFHFCCCPVIGSCEAVRVVDHDQDQ